MDQQTHNKLVEHDKRFRQMEEALEKLQEENNYLRMCFDVLRDKAQALAIMVGDFRDRPAGSLRDRMSGMEEHIVEKNFREEIFNQFKTDDQEPQPKLPLRAAFEQEAKRLEEMMAEE